MSGSEAARTAAAEILTVLEMMAVVSVLGLVVTLIFGHEDKEA